MDSTSGAGESGASRLDFLKLSALQFEEADAHRFPALHLAWPALRAKPGTTAVLNAANEVAVAAFLDGTIPFTGIHKVNAATLEAVVPGDDAVASVEALVALDAEARASAAQLVQRLAR